MMSFQDGLVLQGEWIEGSFTGEEEIFDQHQGFEK